MPESSAQDIPKQEYVVSVFNLLLGTVCHLEVVQVWGFYTANLRHMNASNT